MGTCSCRFSVLRYRTNVKMVQRLTYQYKKKPRQIPKCGICKTTLRGIRPARAHERKRMSLREKKVCRAYGGNLCHICVREKIVRAFLIEEQKIVAKVLKAQQAAVKS